jgi:hypothetical protein
MWKLIDEVMWADDCRTAPDDQVRHPNGVHEFYGCFDCLEEGIVKATEERIIKLLEHEIEGFESEINQLDDGDSLSKGFFLEDIRQHKYLIALIKGEDN